MDGLMSAWDSHDDGILELELADAGLQLDPCGLWIDAGQNLGALKHEGHVVVGWISIEWRGAVPPPDFVLNDAVHLARPVDAARLAEVIDQARTEGIARRQTCRFCGESFNPGWMHEDDVCQGCAEAHLGVSH
jgi:hypothetical protein